MRSGSSRGQAVTPSDRVECAAVMLSYNDFRWVTGTALKARVRLYCLSVFWVVAAVTVRDGGALPLPVAALLPLKAR